jgi:hypothetical protein
MPLDLNLYPIYQIGAKGLDSLLEFLLFFTRNFGKKRPILDKHEKNLLVILEKSF